MAISGGYLITCIEKRVWKWRYTNQHGERIWIMALIMKWHRKKIWAKINNLNNNNGVTKKYIMAMKIIMVIVMAWKAKEISASNVEVMKMAGGSIAKWRRMRKYHRRKINQYHAAMQWLKWRNNRRQLWKWRIGENQLARKCQQWRRRKRKR